MNIIDLIKKVIEGKAEAFFYTPKIYKEGRSYLFGKNKQIIKEKSRSDFEQKLNQLDEIVKKDFLGFGYFTYEAGYFFEERLNGLIDDNSRNAFFEFREYEKGEVETFTKDEVTYDGIENYLIQNKHFISDLSFNTNKDEFIDAINKIKKYIRDGDTYQVNYTVKSRFKVDGDLTAFFISLIFSQSAKYISLINLDDKLIISFSPELFFKIDNSTITAQPMKGTIKRGKNIFDDGANYITLRSSSKERAENIMIVDLLRNDLGKICEVDSVKTKDQFTIEKYESVFQMISTVIGKLNEFDFSSIIRNIFPCGSVTGAPKIRTMEIIKELEKEERGIYTGAIGIIEKKKMTFNVPIRTIVIDKKSKSGEFGLGSGVVWDSQPESEYDEVITKANFVFKPQPYFKLIESMLVKNKEIFLLDLHMSRMKQSAEFFLFNFDLDKIKTILKQSVLDLEANKKYKLRLTIDKWGNPEIETSEVADNVKPYRVIISDKKVNSNNKFLYFKTTNRQLYNSELVIAKENDYDEVIFFNEDGELTEGSSTNIIIKLGNKYFTPPISSGVLDGCYRKMLIENRKDFEEKVITFEEILVSDRMFLINSVRKEIPVHSISKGNKVIKNFVHDFD